MKKFGKGIIPFPWRITMISKNKITRIFIVGTARSGTTLLQSMLAVHPEILSFPETHFLRGTVPKTPLQRIFKIYSRKDQRFISNKLEKMRKLEYKKRIPVSTPSTLEWIRGLLAILDLFATDRNMNIWLEKTPMHLYFIPLIEKIDPETKFIHMIRQGENVVASLHEASQKHPKYFDGIKSVNQCIRRWRKDIRISKNYIGKDNHHFVFYKQLINHPEETLKKTVSFINVDYKSEMLSFREITGELKFPEEEWKKSGSNELRESNKFENHFSKEEQKYILSKVKDFDLSELFAN